MATLGPLSIKLTAEASGVAAGVARAQASLKSLASSVNTIKGVVAGALGAVGIGLSVGAIKSFIGGQMDAIDAAAKLSDRLNITTESLTGLQHAASLAGVSNEQLTGGFEKMLKTLGGLSEDGIDVGNVFADIGLDASALRNAAPDQAFLDIADALAKIDNPAARATAATKIFGRAGQELLPLMLSGAEGIKAAQVEAQKLGLTFSRVDAAKVEAANDAITRMGAVFVGIGRTLAIGIAPYVEALASKFVEISTAGEGIGPHVAAGVRFAIQGIAAFTDYVKLLEAAFFGFRATALQSVADVFDAVAKLVDSKVIRVVSPQVTALLPSADDLRAQAQGFSQVAAEEAGKLNEALAAFHDGKNSKAAAAFFDDIEARAKKTAEAIANPEIVSGGLLGALNKELPPAAENLKKVADLLAKMQEDVNTFGLSGPDKNLFDLKALGATDEQIAQAQALADKQKALQALSTPPPSTGDALTDFAAQMERIQQAYAAGTVSAEQFAAARDKASDSLNKSLADSAKQITESVKTPLEKYTEQVDLLNELLNRKLIDQSVFDRAKGSAAAAFFGKDNGAEEPKFAAAIERRFTFSTPNQQAVISNDPVKVAQDQLKVQQDALAQERRQAAALDKIAGSFTTSGGTTLTVVSIN